MKKPRPQQVGNVDNKIENQQDQRLLPCENTSGDNLWENNLGDIGREASWQEKQDAYRLQQEMIK